MNINIFVFILAFLSSLSTITIFIPLLRKISNAEENYRTLHKGTKVSGAGIVFSSIATFGSIYTSQFALALPFLFAILGFLDDVFNLNKWIRLVSHTVLSNKCKKK